MKLNSWNPKSAALTIALFLPLISLEPVALAQSKGDRDASSTAVAITRVARLRRGVNLSHWFSQSPGRDYSEKHLSTFMTRKDIDLIRNIGFDHVRFPVNSRLFYQDDSPSQLNPRFVGNFDASLDMILSTGLSVIVDMHPDDDFKLQLRADDNQVARFAAFWKALAAHLSGRDPEHLFLEILNEPMVEDPSRWAEIQSKFAAAIRSGAPKHTIIATGGRWSAIDELMLLKPLADGNVIYNFHFYEPHTFTHQSATWGAKAWPFLKNIPYPSSVEIIDPFLPGIDNAPARETLREYGMEHWDASKVDQVISAAANWANKYDVPLTCNEFGVYRAHTPEDSRLNWISDVRTVLEKHGIGWTMWDYADGFGVAVRKDEKVVVDPRTEAALGLVRQNATR